MKLGLSENLRRLRRERNLSQEQLGERLGVTPQSISHWECGTAYPDLETVPLIAGFFGVTTDELLGISGTVIAERKRDYWDAFDHAADSERADILRRACAEFPHDWEFAYRLCELLSKRGPACADEILRVSYEALDTFTDGWQRALFIEFIAIYEDEHDVYAFLDRMTCDRDIRSNKLLELRYGHGGDGDLLSAITRFNTARDTETLLWRDPEPDDDPIRRIRANLDYLNAISGVDADTARLHPILGDGVVDMWVDVRVYNGFCLACRLAGAGDTDGALAAFEETAEVCERFHYLPDGSVMSYRTDRSGRLDVRITTDGAGWRHAEFLQRVGLTSPDKPEKLPAWPPDFGLNIFTDTGWPLSAAPEQIREHPRYLACVERLKKLVYKK